MVHLALYCILKSCLFLRKRACVECRGNEWSGAGTAGGGVAVLEVFITC